MAVGIESAGQGLKTTLAAFYTDKKYARQIFAPDELPNSIRVFPTFVILLGKSLPATFGYATQDVIFRVVIMLGRIENPSGADKLIKYVEKSGTYSLYAAIETDPQLSSSADDAEVLGNTGLGTTEWGGTPYLSTEFEVRCYV